MQNSNKKIIRIGIIIFALIVIVSIVLILITSLSQRQQYVSIQNYDSTVKNLSKEMKTSMESYLYLLVSTNSGSGDINGATIKDAYIRDGSSSQSHSNENGYEGTFIIDIESLKQSFEARYYYYPPDPNSIGQPVYLGCLKPDKLIYGEFDCKQIAADAEKDDSTDPIIQYLPYESLSFNIYADATDENNLIINAKLFIPDSYLSGSQQTRQSAVVAYKKEVTDWLKSKDLDPSKYTIKYNYDDSGNAI